MHTFTPRIAHPSTNNTQPASFIEPLESRIAPAVVLGALSVAAANEGALTTLQGSFADSEGSDSHALTVAWGEPNSGSFFKLAPVKTLTTNQSFTSSTDDAVLTITSVNQGTGEVNFRVGHRYLNDSMSGVGQSSYDVSIALNSSVSGFESRNFSGWETETDGGRVAVVSTYTAQPKATRTYLPVEGSSLALAVAGEEWVPTTISRTFSVAAGESISGFAFFDAIDHIFYNDQAYVVIKSGGDVLATVFSSNVHAVGSYGETPWTSWSHTFAASGTYTLEAGVMNIDDSGNSSVLGLDAVRLPLGGGSNATTSVAIPNVAPTLAPLTLSTTTIEAGGAVTVSGSFSDPGSLDRHGVQIAWGTGDVSTVPFVTAADGTKFFSTTYTYPANEPAPSYTILATVTDNAGGFSTASSEITVQSTNVLLAGSE
jgi:hypothetical protein